MTDGRFSYLLKVGIPLLLCVHLRDNGQSLGDADGQLDSPRLDFVKKKEEVASLRNTGENKKVRQKVNIAEAFTKPGVQMVYMRTWSLQEVVPARVNLWTVL